MRPIIQFLFSRLSGPWLRMWAQQSLGPTPFAAMTPVSIPDVGVIAASLIPVAGVVLLVLIVSSVVELYDRSRSREKRKDRNAVTPTRLGWAA